jgi:hypothetical protein
MRSVALFPDVPRPGLPVVLVLSACSGGAGPPGPTAAEVVAVREIGVVRNPALTGVRRDGGASGRVDGRMFWTFRETRLAAPGEDGLTSRSNTAAYAELAAPTVLSEPLDARGAPRPLLAFTAEELAYNASTGDPDARYALWPTAVIPVGENGHVLYRRVRLAPGAEPAPVSTGIAFVRQGATEGERLAELFAAPAPQFHDAAVLDTGVLKLLACGASGRCRVARAPLERAAERAAYEFWTGAEWSPDVARAAETVPGAPGALSIAYNSYLERFVALESDGRRVVLRTAEHPEGPWGPDLPVHDAGAAIRDTVQHVELAAEAGRRFFFSYVLADDVRLFEVTLR